MDDIVKTLKEHGFLDADGKWQCTKCGACCRFVRCKLVLPDNTCPIYDTRPYMCRTDPMHFTDIEQAKACLRLYSFIEAGCL